MPVTRRCALGLIAAAAATPAGAAPPARLIDARWQESGTAGDPDYGAWETFLKRHVVTETADGVTRVDYAAAGNDARTLASCLSAMTAVDPRRMTRAAAMSYWINLYNALTIHLVVEAWPVRSIKSVRGGLFKSGPWDEKVVRVAGIRLSLDDIEHGILRPVWRDTRIHYAVNCASIGCPNLAPRPYRSDRLEAMLEEGAHAYVAHPRGAEVTAKGLIVSSIYDWFREDFGGSETGVIDHLLLYADAAKRNRIAAAGGIAGHRYDWSINAGSVSDS